MILLDKPRWPWRGRLWGHMVSDVSLEELHAFALNIGKRRIGFQGDHYDINEDEHQLALEAGATKVDSRELVRRLRDSGLRQRSNSPPWNIVYESKRIQKLSELLLIVSTHVSCHEYRTRFCRTLRSGDPQLAVLSTLIVERSEASAVVLEVNESPLLDATGLDLFINNEAGDARLIELIIGDC
ncbi:MAG: DUF4031 domain-containing protein [Acidimicrobiales bacterium]|nr:DUF4031 domain-containing protein [Acidimicrobiales bacterium]OUW86926.1 MAG: hypothetical protein CBD84_04145 [Acidimicrobiaceae bacterium TMED224]|tara:strand:+ start:14635 stop:15186 length:552 start_codon:yes stop_codon:yes gene_type:complete